MIWRLFLNEVRRRSQTLDVFVEKVEKAMAFDFRNKFQGKTEMESRSKKRSDDSIGARVRELGSSVI